MTEKKPYLPKARTGYNPTDDELRSFSPKGYSTLIPNPVTDPIVANNIACQEFNYTEDLEEDDDTF